MRTRIDAKDLVTVRASRQEEKFDGFKPTGFWYSVDRGWEEWCQGDMPGWLENKYEHRVELGEEKMIYIRSLADIDAFHEKYKREGEIFNSEFIDWTKVAADYDGIEISPYLWKRRHSMLWYYGWDCSSGCIWNPKGVKVVLVGAFTPRRESVDQE